MNPLDALTAELKQEAIATRKLLALVPADKLDFKLNPKGMALGNLASHIATIPGRTSGMALLDGFDFPETRPAPAPVAPGTDFVALLDESVAQGVANIASLDPATLGDTWSVRVKGEVKMSLPRIAVIRVMTLNHWYHHRGQLTAFLRALDIALPSVYGPTADVNPFD